MINLAELEQYFPEPGRPVKEGKYTFTVVLDQDEEENTFIINLRIRQEDSKDGHLIKFRVGLGKDHKTMSNVHETHKPHFEIDIYRREKDSFSATAYFTFDGADDKELMEYAKGTISLISKVILLFLEARNLEKTVVERIIYEKAVREELSGFEPILIDALYDCYKKSDLVVRQGNEAVTIKTEHNLSKYLDAPDLRPLYLPLIEKIRASEKSNPEKQDRT